MLHLCRDMSKVIGRNGIFYYHRRSDDTGSLDAKHWKYYGALDEYKGKAAEYRQPRLELLVLLSFLLKIWMMVMMLGVLSNYSWLPDTSPSSKPNIGSLRCCISLVPISGVSCSTTPASSTPVAGVSFSLSLLSVTSIATQ